MKKFKLFFRFEKEEKWLEEMAENGWLLSRKNLFYYFRKIKPGHRVIRMDYRTFKSKNDFLDYCALFEDSGWRHIVGTKSSGEQYFLKTSSSYSEDIFSDSNSKAGRYKRISEMCLIFAIMYLPITISAWPGYELLLSPKEWYLTPGLWELEGLSFWWAFLFETPFAVTRSLGFLYFPLLFLGFAVASNILCRRKTM